MVKDKISIIIPCYNVENFIKRCLNSVFAQIVETVDYEVICIDDKSTDNTLGILMSYEKQYSRSMTVIALEENGKQGRARNIALDYANGEYIMYVDADDVIADRMLETLYCVASKYRCDIAECAYKTFTDELVDSVETKGEAEFWDMKNERHKKACMLRHFHKTAPWGRLYKKDLLEYGDVFFPESITMEDIYFSELCMAHMSRYAYIPETLYFYYINPEGTYHNSQALTYYMDSMQVQNWATDRIIEDRLLVDCRQEWEYLHFLKAVCEPIVRMLKDKEFFSYKNYLWIMEELWGRYPEVAENRYVRNADSPAISFSREVVRKKYSEQELAMLMYGENYADVLSAKSNHEIYTD